jgi:hypothetical protein
MDEPVVKSDRKRSHSKYYMTNTKNTTMEISFEGKIYYFEPSVKKEVSKELYSNIKSSKLLKEVN